MGRLCRFSLYYRLFLAEDLPPPPPPQSPQSQQSPPPQSQSQSPAAQTRMSSTMAATTMRSPKEAKEENRKRGESSSEQAAHRQITEIPTVRSRKNPRLHSPLSSLRIHKITEVIAKPRVQSPVIPVISPYRSGQRLMKTASTTNSRITAPAQTVISAEVGVLPKWR